MKRHASLLASLILLGLVASACGPGPAPPSTPVPLTATPVPPTATPAPSPTPLPPTSTPLPTFTPLPPTATPIPPTSTPAPATDTVCLAGCDFTTLQAAIDAVDKGAVIEVTEPIHTEVGIVVNKDVTIRGLGAAQTVVQAHDAPGAAPDRVFLIEAGASVTLEGMTIRHGKPSVQEDDGGGIRNFGTLTLKSCVVTGNVANGGGGIGNSGDLTVINTTVSDNRANGIVPPGTRFDCGSGGGIKCGSGTLALVNSTVSGNQAETRNKGAGGGVHVGCGCVAVLTNSTISGNSTVHFGGGVHTRGVLQLVHCTISDNATEKGGGVYVGPGGRLDYENTIIAGNAGRGNCFLAGPGDDRPEATLGVSSGNLVEGGGCSPDLSGDPLLGPLSDNGGDTLTHALLPGSPAIDAIAVVSCTLPADQRGASRPVVQVSADTPCDIGALELQGETTSVD